MEKELLLLRLYVEVFSGSSGKTLTTTETHATIAERLISHGVVLGWPIVTASNVDNKIDEVGRKGKKVYKKFRLKTRTSAPVEDDFDLKVSKLFWRKYVLYSGLYYSFSFFLYRLLTKSGQTSMCTTLSFLKASHSALQGIMLPEVMKMVLFMAVTHRPQPKLLPLLHCLPQANQGIVTVIQTWRPPRSQVKNDKKEINIIRVWRAVQQDAEGGDSSGRESRERGKMLS